ncbi:hypothetical protein GCM10025865_02540 [Paraoerskovia sediminicola]|uniref:Choline/glycine/proline betaine transport protein n=1 Tax=Paraoerskovia sediminicola TaxID=1138587 RepID=A0ABN6X833_9CELL|nr:hypothetical protein GCM10025865_02540 [Paraoerskovia sediminicola]
MSSPGTAQKKKSTVSRRVFIPAASLIVAFVVVAMIFPEAMTDTMNTLQSEVVGDFGWYYILLVAVFIAFAIFMGISRFGDIVLGKDDDQPEFSLPVWFAMLFATGMGIGLVYWGVAEPLSHYISPKPGVEGSPARLAQQAIAQSYVHWGIHAWAIYVVVGLALAYAIHRKGRPVSIRWALEPILGDRVKGRWGDTIDVIAIIGTVFGVATSLGFGVLQIGAGLEFTGVATSTTALQIGLIAVITLIATASVASGLGKGIKWLSNGNMVAAAFLMVVVLVLGPTLFLLQDFVQSIGYYLSNVLQMTFDNSAYQGRRGASGRRRGRPSTGAGGSRGHRSSESSSPGSPRGAPCGSSSPAPCWSRPSSPSCGSPSWAGARSTGRCSRTTRSWAPRTRPQGRWTATRRCST